MTDFRKLSRNSWDDGGSNTIDKINSGSLQRIADATEKMAASYDEMRRDRDCWEERAEWRSREIDRLARSIRSLRGVITRLKRSAAPTTGGET